VSAAAEDAEPRRRKGFDRPRFLWVLYGAMCAYLFVPILVVMVYSFNSSNSLQVFGGLSTRWYRAFWNDPQIKDSLVASLEVAAVTMVVATFLGTLLAFGLVRARGRIGGEGAAAECESHGDGRCDAKVARENHGASCCEIVIRVYPKDVQSRTPGSRLTLVG
jgi:hypothetical protein